MRVGQAGWVGLLLVAAAAAWALSPPPAEPPAAGSRLPPETGLVSEVTNRLAVGRTVTICLPSNPTTGYGWRLAVPAPDAAVVQCVTNVYQGPENRLLGAGGRELWTFRAVGPGLVVIILEYVRPWEKDQPPVEVRRFPVVVR